MRFSLPLLLLLPFALQAQVPAEKALATFKVADGLQVELFAAEPMVINPTNMDIDPLGRVWITEAVNYRCKLRNKPLNRPEGDRIVILTDKDGDGKADESTVFYQGTELYGPLGICIVPFANKDAKNGIGYRVLVSQSPDILEFWDKDGDGKADGPPTKFLSGFGGFDHDHGVHSIQVGPDGKFYFTIGDQGFKDLKSRDGKQTFSQNNTTMRAGTIWRCDPDGNNLELIAHNFRNEYEACVDSFGEIWCSDNDDDGNKQTRICYVMPGGNYGYHPRGKGESHWHQEQPGIVPNVLRTGFGSPCGICCYEGSLLPEKYRGQLLHVDAGPRELRCFHKKPKGAGYELDTTVMLTSTDNWYRPSDVCVAPDGSVFVCDWYDPGVGGHGMGDTTRGRVYRVTPKGHKGYRTVFGIENGDKLIDAFMSPNPSSRALAQPIVSNVIAGKPNALALSMKDLDKSKHKMIIDKNSNARFDWLHSQYSPIPDFTDNGALNDNISAFEIRRLGSIGFRFTGILENLALPTIASWRIDACREFCISMRTDPPNQCGRLFLALSKRYDGQDRFYLAALNIACGTDPARREAILADFDKHFPEWNDKVADLVWELRPKCYMPKLDGLLKDSKFTVAQKKRIVDVIAAYDDPAIALTLLGHVRGDLDAEVKTHAVAHLQRLVPPKWPHLAKGAEMKAAIADLLKNPKTRVTGLQLVAAMRAEEQLNEVIRFCDVNGGGKELIDMDVQMEALRTLGRLRKTEVIAKLVENAYSEGRLSDSQKAMIAIQSLGLLIEKDAKDDLSKQALKALEEIVMSTQPTAYTARKAAAITELAGNANGAAWLLKLKDDGKFPKELEAEAGPLLRNSPFRNVQDKAKALFPAAVKLDLKKLSPPAELAKRTGDAKRGREVFLASFKGEAQCMKCHTVNKEGGAIGPDLSAIGKKASRENLFESILSPSKAIADQFITWKIETDDGQAVSGLIVKETPEEVTLRDANGKDYTFKAKGLEKKKSPQSLMAEDVAKALTEQELVDLVEYLFSLKE